ncbi:MAG TPA: HAMP domain-containing sensor histidine kinase [Eubacteriales bacterium]|nr:HAMP domain-containing sensor histidine kinase [Eubacteriales bacterium]
MTIRRQWMLVLIVSVALSVLVNSIVLSTLVNRYFIEYSTENYEQHITQLTAFASDALSSGEYSEQQLEVQLESHLSDPINRIRLYNSGGDLLADVGDSDYQTMGMMRSEMMSRMMGNASEEVDSIDIEQDGTMLGTLIVTRYSSIGTSLATRQFTLSLIGSGLLSFGVVFALALIVGLFISRKMSRDLTLTAQQAIDVDLGRESYIPNSHVKEIRTIQQSLETLRSRLKLKQTSRKKRIDEFVHQTRTPLTILRTHLEGFRDGVIQFNPGEVATCEAQIDHLSSIITNMSGLLDAEKEIGEVSIEPVEISALIRQIADGLKAQFDKKHVRLEVIGHRKIVMHTDRYKLSQALYNIVTNAYKFTEAGGSVTISYELLNGELTLSVQDTGSGIPKEDQPKIFEAYYRGKNSLNSEGDGIGLYVVKENLEKIGGTIEVESKPGAGSKFTLLIPEKAFDAPHGGG